MEKKGDREGERYPSFSSQGENRKKGEGNRGGEKKGGGYQLNLLCNRTREEEGERKGEKKPDSNFNKPEKYKNLREEKREGRDAK